MIRIQRTQFVACKDWLQWHEVCNGKIKYVSQSFCLNRRRYAWHMIFGEPPVIAPFAECELLNCTGGAGGTTLQPRTSISNNAAA